MPVTLSQAAFCALILESGLITENRLTSLRKQFEREGPARNPENCLEFTEYLVRTNELTLWQAQKLVQGKHKGFRIGKYKLLSLLGRGGMSSVYLAEHTVMRRRCAIKILPFKQVKNAAALSRFYREAQAVAALDNPHIVRAYDVDRLTEGGNDIHFLVMEYVDGRSLQQVVDDDGPLPIAAAVEYTRQAANGLAHAHSVGVVHRDVKPSNLLLDESGTIKLLDLGLARIFEDASEQPSLTIEHQQTVLGTADYLSPEQAVDSHGVDYRSDLYSLGCTLYFLLTGHPPFTEGSLTQRLLAHQNKAPAPVTASRPGVPATLASLIERMMAKRPDARFQTAEDLQGALTAWLRDHVGEIPTSERLVHRPARTAARSTQIPKARSGSASAGSSDAAARPKPKHLGKRRQNPSPAGSLPVGELEDGLTAFLRSLESDIEHDTVTPSFPTSETIVSNADIRDQPTDSDANVSVISHDWIVSQPTPGGTAGREQSGSAVSTLWAQISQARRSGAIPQWALAAMLGGALVTGGIAIAYLVPAGRQSNGSAAEGTNGQPDVTSDPAGAAAPEIEPGEDIRVGPDGHFSSIGAALLYVRETFHPLHPKDVRRIRVSGGQTYVERIVIDNSQSRSFPQGVHVVCDDAPPAILQPAGTDPVVDLRTVERFHLKGLTIRGTGQPTLIRLEGYLVGTNLQDLVLEGTADTAVLGVGATGFPGGNRLTLRNITFREPQSRAVAMQFRSTPTASKNILIRGCRVLKGFEAGIRFVGGVSGFEIAECIFDSTDTGLEFDAASETWDDVVVANCTFRAFDHGIVLGRSPSPSDGSFRVTKNLFAGGHGPECQIGDGSATSQPMPPQFTASFNWTQRPAPPQPKPGEVDLFQQDGRRGAGLTFVTVDPAQPSTYLQPESSELREASALLPQLPKHIGAVPPAAN